VEILIGLALAAGVLWLILAGYGRAIAFVTLSVVSFLFVALVVMSGQPKEPMWGVLPLILCIAASWCVTRIPEALRHLRRRLQQPARP